MYLAVNHHPSIRNFDSIIHVVFIKSDMDKGSFLDPSGVESDLKTERTRNEAFHVSSDQVTAMKDER